MRLATEPIVAFDWGMVVGIIVTLVTAGLIEHVQHPPIDTLLSVSFGAALVGCYLVGALVLAISNARRKAAR
jgi:hypothetical protein